MYIYTCARDWFEKISEQLKNVFQLLAKQKHFARYAWQASPTLPLLETIPKENTKTRQP